MVRAHGGRLHVEVCEPRDQDQVRCAIVGWFRERARTVIPQRVSQLTSSPAFAELQPTAVTVRTMKTRWGSCSASGRLLLNSQLIALPTSLIDYAIAHELCHLKERKHGPRFERLLARVMPDWRVRHECLTKASANCLGDRALPWNLRQQWAMTPDERFDIAKTLRDRVYGADAPDVRESERAKERRLGHLPE